MTRKGDRNSKRQVPFLGRTLPTSCVHRSSLDMLAEIDYVIEDLVSVDVLETDGPTTSIFTTTPACDWRTAEKYAADKMSGAPSRAQCCSSANEENLFFVLLEDAAGLHRCCLRLVAPNELDDIAPFLDVERTTCAAIVVYDVSTDSAERYLTHRIHMLQTKDDISVSGGTPSVSLNASIACGAEWIVPLKKEAEGSTNYVLHSVRIALSLQRMYVRRVAAEIIVSLEEQCTLQVLSELSDIGRLKDELQELESTKERCYQSRIRAENALRCDLENKAENMTALEREKIVALFQRKIDENYAKQMEFDAKIVKRIDEKKSEIARKFIRKRLRADSRTTWAFHFFDPDGSGELPVPALRSALFSLPTHQTLAQCNETLLRIGKEINVQRFGMSFVPYIPLPNEHASPPEAEAQMDQW